MIRILTIRNKKNEFLNCVKVIRAKSSVKKLNMGGAPADLIAIKNQKRRREELKKIIPFIRTILRV